jgi:MFS family permease
MGHLKTMWNRHFFVALIGFYFLFMSITLFFIFPLLFEQFDASKTRIGLIMGIHSLTAILVRPVFGRIIDIKGRKKISLIGIGFLIALLPLFHFIGDAGILPLTLRALGGIGWGISMTAAVTMCSDLAPVSRMAQSMGIIGVAGLLSVALGPLLAEEIVRLFGFGGLYNTSFLFLIISFVCLAATKEVVLPDHNRDFRKPVSLRHIALVPIIVIFSLPVFHGAIRGAVVYFVALFGKSISLDRVGPFFVAFSASAILTRLLLGGLSDRYGRKQVLFPSVLIISLNLVILSQAQSLELLILAGFIGGFGQGMIFPALSTYIIDILGQENKGFAISLYLTFFDIGMGLGPPLFGRISDLYGYRTMYLMAGLVFFLAGLVFAWKAPSPSRIRT